MLVRLLRSIVALPIKSFDYLKTSADDCAAPIGPTLHVNQLSFNPSRPASSTDKRWLSSCLLLLQLCVQVFKVRYHRRRIGRGSNISNGGLATRAPRRLGGPAVSQKFKKYARMYHSKKNKKIFSPEGPRKMFPRVPLLLSTGLEHLKINLTKQCRSTYKRTLLNRPRFGLSTLQG